MKNDFSDWTKENFARWLRENHPKPTKDRWVQFSLHVRHGPDHVFEMIMADDYETCIDELASEMVMYAEGLPEEDWKIIMNPAEHRKKKQMMLYKSES
jgi:hypothetical protein